MGCRSLGGSSSPLRVSGPFPFTTPSLPCSAFPSELQPHVHPRAGSCRCGGGSAGEGGDRACSSFPGLLQPFVYHSQGHWGLASGDRPLTPQRLGGCLLFPHGDYPVCSPVSPPGGLDGIPGSPGCIPPGSGSSVIATLPEVWHGRVGFPISRPLLWPVDGSAGFYTHHGPSLYDNASSRFPNPLVPQRLACSGLLFSGDRTGEGFPSLALSTTGDSDQHSQEFSDTDSFAQLFRDDDSDRSFEGFPGPQVLSEVVVSPSILSLRQPPASVCLVTASGSNVLHVSSRSGCAVSWDDSCLPDL